MRYKISTLLVLLMILAGGCGSNSTPLPTIKISVAPASIPEGHTAMLTWTTTDATQCSTNGAWSGPQPTNGSLSVTPTSVGPFSYSINCMGVGGTQAAGAILTVTTPIAPTVSIAVSPSTVAANQSATVTWSSTETTSCAGSGGWSGDQAVNGAMNVTPTDFSNISYTLTCAGVGGTAAQTATLTVAKDPNCPVIPQPAARIGKRTSRANLKQTIR